MGRKKRRKRNNLKTNKRVSEVSLHIDVNAELDKALSFHQIGNLRQAEELYRKILKANPQNEDALHFLGILVFQLGQYDAASDLIYQAIKLNPEQSIFFDSLGTVLKAQQNTEKAMEAYCRALEINPNNFKAYNNIGILLQEIGKYQESIKVLHKAIEINPKYDEAIYNLGLVLQTQGNLEGSIQAYQRAIAINPNYVDAHNNLGSVLKELREYQKAVSCYEKAIQIQPNHANAHWCLHSFAPDIDEALKILKKSYRVNNKFLKTKIMISALQGFKGNFKDFDVLVASPEANHPYTRSIKWVFSLPQLPKIFFNRWDFYDSVVALADKSRPFYEFGVWNGISFRYLINTFGKGFGFDTFSGLPESWNNIAEGSYSSFGSVPKITGGEFIVGEFKHTLPKFFSKKKPLASLINFDADLYSSTLCALNYSNKVIDEKSILIFDEFLMNENWEKDEYKTLNEFCNNFSISYDVLAVSFFSKQVAVKLKKN